MPNNSEEKEEFLEVPADRVSAEALQALVEEFILREGTDYGHSELSLEDKKNKVMKQMDSGRVIIAYSLLTENTTLMLKADLAKL